MHLRRKHQPPVTIISAYQVCPRPTNLLGNTAYHQQVRALNARGLTQLHPRKAFVQDLESYIRQLQSRGHSIILGGDFNESLSDKNSGILKLAMSLNLMDPFVTRFPNNESFGTHTHGNRRIDMVLTSPELLSTIENIGYAPFYYAKPSDHRPLLIDFRTKRLFGSNTLNLQPAGNRLIKTKDKPAVTRFITEWHRQITDRNGFALKQELNADNCGPEVVETLDAIIGISGSIAEQACKRRRPQFYSRKLVQQRLRVSILRGHLQSVKQGKDRTPQLQNRMARGGITVCLPPTIRGTAQLLRQESATLQQMNRDHAELRDHELSEKVEAAAVTGNKSKAQILRVIRKKEANRKTYQILQQMKRKQAATPKIDRVEIPLSWPDPQSNSHPTIEQLEDPKTCIDWKLITDPKHVEYYLMLRNQIHFGQAEGTPY